VDRSWHALDSVLPQEEANSEADQEKSGDVVSHTEKIVRSNDRHNQWGHQLQLRACPEKTFLKLLLVSCLPFYE
jgi:hypothetical protein